jgi:hypothetical protein
MDPTRHAPAFVARVFIVLIVAATMTLTVGVGDAAAAPTWTIQSTPNPTGAKGTTLRAVDCPAATACTAVGDYTSSSDANLSLAERWNGSSWVIQPTPNPAGGTNNRFNAVSCPTTAVCTAVGRTYNAGNGQYSLVERWNGTSWVLQSAPRPTGSILTEFFGVSCATATSCIAVGEYRNASNTYLTLAERWNGTSWTIKSTPNPAGATFPTLQAVSCTSATACTAVGTYTNASGTDVTLAERWNGTTWVIQPTPNHAGATGSYLQGVSCTSATACTATGGYFNSAGTLLTLAERWNGSTWTIQSTPNRTGATENYLYAVSCTSATACTATGSDQNSSNITVTLVEQWNGTAWVIKPSPNPVGAAVSALYSVSCSAAAVCTATGESRTSTGVFKTLAERYA